MHLLLLPEKKKKKGLNLFMEHTTPTRFGVNNFFFSLLERGGQLLSKRHLLVRPVGAAVVDKREK